MARRNHAAGGFFLVLAILGGFAWGAMSGMPFFGTLVGTAIGIVIGLASRAPLTFFDEPYLGLDAVALEAVPPRASTFWMRESRWTEA